jgi:hypothetical protein
MKYLRFSLMNVDKAAQIAQASDKALASSPAGVKMLANHVCLGIAFPDQPMNTLVSVAIIEADSAEALAAISYPVMVAGTSIWHVPVMELPVGGAAAVEKKVRG